ncbi:MAG TPA: P27 family phage terminase small subunit [Bacteroidales bacterium]|nr:P27 family phage terminase small subunit [Bacteroidales bacterium]
MNSINLPKRDKLIKNKARAEKAATTRKENKYVLLKRNIIKLLEGKGVKEEIDITMVDQLVFNYKLIDRVMNDLLSGDYMTQVRKDENYPLLQVSAQSTIYNNCLKNILALSTKLGITVQERQKLGLSKSVESHDDGF